MLVVVENPCWGERETKRVVKICGLKERTLLKGFLKVVIV